MAFSAYTRTKLSAEAFSASYSWFSYTWLLSSFHSSRNLPYCLSVILRMKINYVRIQSSRFHRKVTVLLFFYTLLSFCNFIVYFKSTPFLVCEETLNKISVPLSLSLSLYFFPFSFLSSLLSFL